MANAKSAKRRESNRARRHMRIRRKVVGTQERPRLVIHRSLKNVQAHLVDDVAGKVLMGVSTTSPELKKLRGGDEGSKTALSKAAGKAIAEKARDAGIENVVFDRGGYLYHGRVAAFAEGAREGGLKF